MENPETFPAPKFPHLENLDKVPQVLTAEEIHISEKIDGFNARFGRSMDDIFWIGTRNQVIYAERMDKAETEKPDQSVAQGLAEYAWHRRRETEKGVTSFGEWAGTGIQKRINYGPREFYLFATMDHGRFRNPEGLEEDADKIGTRIAPFLYMGKNPGIESLNEWRSHGGIEGIVIVPVPMMYDVYGNPMIAKFKNPNFEERKSKREERPTEDLSSLEAIVQEYSTNERMLHIFARLQNEHNIAEPWQVEHTGEYLRAFYDDVLEDAKAELEGLEPAMAKKLGKYLNPHAKDLRDEYILSLLMEPDQGGEG